MEAKAMALAHEMGLFTASMACDPDQAQEMAKSGADILIAYPLPWETPQETRPWEGEMGVALAALCEAARSVRSDLPVLALTLTLPTEERQTFPKHRFPGLSGSFYWEH
jgi:predicted TIM-barrel enzyme